eukprot:210123-Alexandrium_andersonii.AAC.1
MVLFRPEIHALLHWHRSTARPDSEHDPMRLLCAWAYRQLWGSGLPRAAAPAQVAVNCLPPAVEHQTVPQASD